MYLLIHGKSLNSLSFSTGVCRRLLSASSRRIKLVEVGPRDGLQNEKSIIPTRVKVELVEKLVKAGVRHIEVSSFVDPKRVPQLADAPTVFSQIRRLSAATYIALVPNAVGMRSALRAKVDEVAVFTAASETFAKRNINCSVDESITRFEQVLSMAKSKNVAVRGYISCVLGCPYEGAVPPDTVARIAEHLWKSGCYEISLGDTIGVGTPETMHTLLQTLRRSGACPQEALAVHCHETRGHALANIAVALSDEHAIQVVDAAIGGLGGCPFAGPGAPGNVSTEAVVSQLLKDGYRFTNELDIAELKNIGIWIRHEIAQAVQLPSDAAKS